MTPPAGLVLWDREQDAGRWKAELRGWREPAWAGHARPPRRLTSPPFLFSVSALSSLGTVTGLAGHSWLYHTHPFSAGKSRALSGLLSILVGAGESLAWSPDLGTGQRVFRPLQINTQDPDLPAFSLKFLRSLSPFCPVSSFRAVHVSLPSLTCVSVSVPGAAPSLPGSAGCLPALSSR